MYRLVLLALPIMPADGAGCNGGKCNAPTTYTAMTIDPNGSLPEYVKSTDFSSNWETAIKSSVNLVRNFLGSASGNKFFLYGANEPEPNYAAVTAAWCEYTQPLPLRAPDCGDHEKNAAMTYQYPAYMVSGRNPACTCGDYTIEVAPILFRPDPGDMAATVWEIAAHEYTHAIQKAFGGPMPAWLMEGGAVHMQCVMGAIRPSEYGGPVQYSECFKTGGGRDGGIVGNVRRIYNRVDAVNWLTLYGTDRPCGTEAVPEYVQKNPLPTDDDFRQGDYLWYDTGALAVAFAINKGGRTTSDFWREGGFWHSHEPYGNIDYSTGWESDVPEGKGWRKALADFSGYATSAEFFAAFEEFVRPSGTTASEQELLAILEGDVSIASQAASTASFAKRGPLSSCEVATTSETDRATTTARPGSGASSDDKTSTTGSTSGASSGDTNATTTALSGHTSNGAERGVVSTIVLATIALASMAFEF
eukprot:TRINITY_DN42358_c0_g1_i1.p1 TRINITY_DN42358_c0_g1~~TRINITY_DN42358_c0_g1_i1.p1  ORF type:complete len:475 (+),score=72.89 TRINITY_DN42358_c0_g1_i1:73-1497(+)